jgi:hypothetical protein
MLSPYPEYTKQTKTSNNLYLENSQTFLRPMISNNSVPISFDHEHYNIQNDISNIYDLERNSICTRNSNTDTKKPVQHNFQNNYYTTSFDNLNIENNLEINKYLTRNPINSRRDDLEKIRKTEQQDFLKIQGGLMSDFNDIKIENTRKYKDSINSSNYIPAPRTLAIPRENV